MLQTGYLTIENVEEFENKIKYYLRIPNTAVRESLISLLFNFKTEITDNILNKSFIVAKAIAVAITNLDSKGFESAFTTFLETIPYEIYWPRESYYEIMMIFALTLSEQLFSSEGSGGTGKLDLHLTTAENDDVIIEIKHGKPPKKPKAPSPETILTELDRLIQAGMDQIDARKYVSRFQGQSNRLVKMAVAVYGRANVKARFEVAENWRLVDEGAGKFKVVRS